MAETIRQNTTSTVDNINKDAGIGDAIYNFFKTDIRFNSASIPHKYKDKKSGAEIDAAFENYFYEIQDPAWFPDSVVRSKKKNLYNHMLNTARFALTYSKIKPAQPSDDGHIGIIEGINDVDANKIENSNKALDFYFTPEAGFPKDLVNSLCKSVVSYAFNQISGIVGVIEKLGSLSVPEDPVSEYSPDTLFFSTQPMIDVQGIMTDERLIQQLKVANLAIRMFLNLFEDSGSSKMGENIISKLGSSFEDLFKKLVLPMIIPLSELEANKGKSLSEIISSATIPDSRLHGLAEKVFMTMIYGTYKAHFRIPMPQNQTYFSIGQGDEGWSSADSALIKGGQMISDFASKYPEVNIPNVFSRRQWRQDSISRSGRTYNCSFYLFNDTLEHFMLNFNYIIHLHALCSPTTDTAFIRPPYLFNLRVPGGLRYLLCTCRCTVKNIGKVRKLGSKDYVLNVIKHIVEQFAWNNELASEELTYCPDGYEVSLKFSSIIPNTWNFDQAYLTNTDIGVPTIENQSVNIY